MAKARKLEQDSAKRPQSFMGRHPILTGVAGVGAGVATLAGAVIAGGKVAGPTLGKVRGVTGEKVVRAAHKLYPNTAKVDVVDSGAGPFQGAYMSGNPLAKNLFRRANIPFTPPVVMAPGGRKAPSGVLAHEMGHAAYHTASPRTENLKGYSSMFGAASTRLGLSIGAGIGAQAAVSKSDLSPEKKRRLRVAAAALPLAIYSPVMLDEAQAWYRGAKIAKAAGAARSGMRDFHRLNAGNMITQGAFVAPATGGAIASGLAYSKRDKARR